MEASRRQHKDRTTESRVSETPSGLEIKEPVKRRRESRSKAAKKAAKVRAPAPQSPPMSELPNLEVPPNMRVEVLRKSVAELVQIARG